MATAGSAVGIADTGSAVMKKSWVGESNFMPSLGTNWPLLFASSGWDCLGSAGAHVGDSPYGLGHMDSVRVPSGTTPQDARQSLARILKWVGGSFGVACFLIHLGVAVFALGQG